MIVINYYCKTFIVQATILTGSCDEVEHLTVTPYNGTPGNIRLSENIRQKL
jgi:hypothetical protein